MYNSTQIVLISPQQGYLDISADAEVPFTYAVSDVRDISKKQGAFSKTIKLAGTKNNNILLNNYFDVNIQAGTFDISKLQRCQVLQNGVPILKDGFLQLLSIKKVQNVVNTEELVEYEIVIKDSVGDLFTKINNLELTDLELGYLDHTFTADKVIETFDNTWEDGYKYFFPFLNSTEYNLNHFKPAIFAKTYFDKIINGAGFEYVWDTYSASTVQFDKLLIPYNGDIIKADQEFIDSVKVRAEKSGDTTYSAVTYVTNFENEIDDPANIFDPVTGEYTNLYYISEGSVLSFNLTIEYEIVLKNTESNTVYLVQDVPSGAISGLRYLPRVKLVKNTTLPPISSANINEFDTDYQVLEGQTIASGGELSLGGVTTRFVTIGTTNAIPNDILSLMLGFDGATVAGFELASQVNTGSFARWRNGPLTSNSAADVFPELRVKNLYLYIQPGLNSISFNATMPMNKVIPNKIKQSDFIKSILTMYNLYVEVDELNTNTLIFRHRDEFYDSGEEVNWTSKIAKNLDQELSLLPDISKKKLVMTYKQDNNDPLLKIYLDSVKEIYGQVEYTFDSDYVRDTETKELIFSPTVVGQNTFGNVLPYINNIAPKNNIKIALNAKQYESNDVLTIFNFQSDTLSGTSSTATTVPLISHFNTESNPNFDINFGVNDYYFYNTIGSLTNNTLYNLYWRRTVNQINNGRLLTAYFNLNETDINSLKLNQRVQINNTWWHINKIIDYKAGKKELTKVELFSIDDELAFSPFVSNSTGNGGGALPDGGGFGLAPNGEFLSLVSEDTNTIFSQNPVVVNGDYNEIGSERNIFVNGDNNIVSGEHSFINGNNNITETSAIIFGDNNYIPANMDGIFIIGEGITATTPYTLFTRNLELPSGGTLNGITIENLNSINLWTSGTGADSIVRNNNSGNIASGASSYSEGSSTQAIGDVTHAEGKETQAIGKYSHAEGSEAITYGYASHAGGYSATTQLDGEWARAGYTEYIIKNQYGIIQGITQTTNATPKRLELYADNISINGYEITENTAIAFTYNVIARDASSGDVRFITGEGLVKNVSGTVSIVYSSSINNNGDASLSTIVVTPYLNSDKLTFSVTGILATTINWSVKIDYNIIG